VREGGYYKRGFLRGAHLLAMLGGTCLRYAAWRVGGLRAVLWHYSGRVMVYLYPKLKGRSR
jgi:hypothetical protein